MCIGRGPAWEADDHGFKSNEIIARRQSDKAVELWEDSKATAIKGNPASFCQLVPSGSPLPASKFLDVACLGIR